MVQNDPFLLLEVHDINRLHSHCICRMVVKHNIKVKFEWDSADADTEIAV